MVVLSEYKNVVMFSELDCKVLRAFLVDGNSYRDIQRKILGLDAPVRGGGYAAMNIVHKYGITKVHKAIFSGQNISKENLIKYVKNIKFQPASNIMNKNKLSNDFLKEVLKSQKIKFIEKSNSFYEISISNHKFILKCRTYNNNYTFVTKSEIPNLSEDIIIALVEWQNEKPTNLYLIPTSEWASGKWSMLKNKKYEGLQSKPEWGIDINKSNKYELSNFSADKILKNLTKNINKKYIEELEKTKYKETEKQALVKIRLGHSKLRDEVIKNKYKCEICGLSYNKLLVASHIKPWSKSDDSEKLDFENILLLCSMHDALFDKGLISFDDNGKILISRELGEEEKALVNINEDSCIDINSQKQKDYLKYHRKNIFIK